MEICLLDYEDAEIYRKLRLMSLKENPESFLTTYGIELEKPIEQIQQNLKISDGRFTLGVFMKNTLVGIVTFVRENHSKILHKGNIYALYVSPDYRGKGIGKKLIKELVIKVKELDGLEQINLTVVSNNIAAKRLYESVGFVTYGLEKNALKFNNQYWDEEFMVLYLNKDVI